MTTYGMIGLGRMGGNMSRRVARAGLEVIAWDRATGARSGLAGHPVSGVMVATGRDADRALCDRLRALDVGGEALAGVTALPGVTVLRYLGASAHAARAYFISAWEVLRPALCGRDTVLPRIWNC